MSKSEKMAVENLSTPTRGEVHPYDKLVSKSQSFDSGNIDSCP